MPLSCVEAQNALHHLQSLETEFNQTLSAAAEAKDEDSANESITKAKSLKSVIEREMAALREQLPFRLERDLNLKEQYESQIHLLKTTGFLERLQSGQEGIKAINGQE